MSKELLLNGEQNSKFRLLHPYTPNILAESVIDEQVWRSFRERNIGVVLFDYEGTVAKTDGWRVIPGLRQRIESHRQWYEEHNPGRKFYEGGVTNKRPKDWITFIKLIALTRQVGAEVCFVPQDSWQRKPSSVMPLQAALYFDSDPSEMAVIGDKASGDVKAGYDSGMWTVWTKRYGWEDLIGDRIGRRPPEAVWRRILEQNPHLLLPSPPRSKAAERLKNKGGKIYKAHEARNLAWSEDKIPEELIDLSGGLITGYGGPIVLLDPDVEPLSLSKRIKESSLYDWWNSEVSEHGGDWADRITDWRLRLALVDAGLIILEQDTAAQIVHGIVQLTDILDGYLARHSKRGATKEGGHRDQRNDKLASFIVGLALVAKGRKPLKNFVLQLVRDYGMSEVIRPHLEDNGIDTKALWSGKLSTFGAAAADNISISAIADSRPEFNRGFQHIATVGKAASAVHETLTWPRIQQIRERDERIAKKVIERLRREKAA